MKSILEHGLIAGGKETKRRKTNHLFTPLNPFGKDEEEAVHGDLSVPRNVHHYSTWKHVQDVVYWVKLSRVQDQGLRFWQTKSHAIIVHNPLPPDCIFNFIAKNGERTLFERLSTPRPAAKITLRSTWQVQQQHQQQQPAPTRLRRLGANRDEGDHRQQRQARSRFPVALRSRHQSLMK